MVLFADDVAANANVTFVFVFDQTTAPGAAVRLKAIVSRIEARLGEFPLLRQRPLRTPLDCDLPYWVDDESFHLEHHVRHIALPKPGDWRQFCIQASRLHARALDMNRPLWELYVIEGLDCFLDLPAGSFALLFKAHCAILGGRTSRDIARLLNDRPATTEVDPAAPWFPANPPGSADLLARAAFNVATIPFRFAAPLTRFLPQLHSLHVSLAQQREESALTRFNAVISQNRVFETRRFALEEIDEIRASAERLSVHDVMLAICGDGLRRYLAHHEEAPTLSVTIALPTSFLNDRAESPIRGGSSISWSRTTIRSRACSPCATAVAAPTTSARAGRCWRTPARPLAR
jgi:WS/DGAT/MGAT family acyltransferase